MPIKSMLALFSLFSMSVTSGEIKPDEQVQFVRGIAYFNDEGVVEAQIGAWVHEHEQRPGAKTAFAKLAGLDLANATAAELANFDYRSQLFRYDSERGKRLQLNLAPGNQISLPVTDSDGMSRSVVRLGPLSTLTVADVPGTPPVIQFELQMLEQDPRHFHGQLVLVPERGLSIVSDIDDTIKDSNVLNRAELIRNTFLRDFKAVPGMAALYQRWLSQADSSRIHYLSSSPHQLYPALDAFLHSATFPLGSVHLRHIDISNEILGNGDGSRQHKLTTLRQLLDQFPLRQFVLVGDSGEADPEIYAEIARTYPAQVIGIYIRDVTRQDASAERYVKTFAGLAPTLWHLFTNPDQLPANALSAMAKR